MPSEEDDLFEFGYELDYDSDPTYDYVTSTEFEDNNITSDNTNLVNNETYSTNTTCSTADTDAIIANDVINANQWELNKVTALTPYELSLSFADDEQQRNLTMFDPPHDGIEFIDSSSQFVTITSTAPAKETTTFDN
ncbi:MAG: hypothetical protein AAF460_13390, partial [Pseudomonadota bacterium]